MVSISSQDFNLHPFFMIFLKTVCSQVKKISTYFASKLVFSYTFHIYTSPSFSSHLEELANVDAFLMLKREKLNAPLGFFYCISLWGCHFDRHYPSFTLLTSERIRQFSAWSQTIRKFFSSTSQNRWSIRSSLYIHSRNRRWCPRILHISYYNYCLSGRECKSQRLIARS